MDNDTPQSTDRQEAQVRAAIAAHEAAREERNLRYFVVGLVLVMALGAVWSRFAPAAPQQPAYYRPDPTPYVVETQRIEVLSNNRFCVGVFEHC